MLHLPSICLLIPWCFAHDKQSCARFLPVYHEEMRRLPEDHTGVFRHFQSGECSVQIGDHNPFNRIFGDQTKDTQTARGTKGFSLKPDPFSIYYINAAYLSKYLNNLSDMIELQRF